MSQKRIRSINWDEEEKQLFRSVLKEYASIIENKSLDNNTNKIKNKAWEEVHKKFNELNVRPRQLGHLKIQWKTMKINARKTYNTFKKETNKTGGGGRPTTPNDMIIEVKDLMNPAELLRDHNIYDSDGIELKPEETNLFSANESCTQPQESVIVITSNIEETCALPTLQDTIHIEDVDDKQIQQSQSSENKSTITAKVMGDSVFPYVETPKTKQASKKPACKYQIRPGTVKSQKNPHSEEYITEMIAHSKELKEKENLKRTEMAEHKHAIEMKILEEKLKTAETERDIVKQKLRTAQVEHEIAEEKLRMIRKSL